MNATVSRQKETVVLTYCMNLDRSCINLKDQDSQNDNIVYMCMLSYVSAISQDSSALFSTPATVIPALTELTQTYG